MKQSHLSSALFCTALALFLISCGSGESNKEAGNESTNADSATTTTVPEVKNTIITTPENMMIAIHKVADFAKWLPVYEAHDSARLANGLHSYVIGRGLEDTNMILVAVKADDLLKAKTFAKDPGLKKAMQKSGVMGKPDIQFATNTWQDTANIGNAPRALISFTVKDWDVFQKSYLGGKQHRDENGLAARVVGHDADNNKKIFLVTALIDAEKAKAFWKSDTLKKIREDAGVTSESKRFMFNIVKRY